ncbi:AAA family ATPase [Shewanella frigidimarina]|jgi:predicted ATPase|uniref:AAA family ATPase n=1 Tax=Shewanella frigidimarina TaxID=56812 RepID=UPI003D796B4D
MRIESITFHGFQAENRHALVDFSKDNVTVIYGDNGCGKTTFLRAINSFLSQDESSLNSLGIFQIDCTVTEFESISTTIHVRRNDDGFDWSEFEKSPLLNSKSLSLGVERGISTQAMKVEPEALYEFFRMSKFARNFIDDRFEHSSGNIARKQMHDMAEELSFFLRRRNMVRNRSRSPEIDFNISHLYLQSIKIQNIEELLLRRYRLARFSATRKIQSALFDTISVAIDTTASNPSVSMIDNDKLAERLIENKERIIEALDDGDENNFKTRIIDTLNNIEIDDNLNKVLEHSLLSQLFSNMIDELEVEKLLLSSINHLVDRFNTYLIDEKNLVVNDKEVYVEIEGVRHSLNELSSGERHILTFLSLVLFEGSNRHFLIIDEPEISLNIKWQRELMKIFSSLLPTTQIIVASHSPALAKRNPDFLSELFVWREA